MKFGIRKYKSGRKIIIKLQFLFLIIALQASVYYLSEYNHFKSIVNKLLEGNVDLTIAQPGPILYICLQYNKVNYAKYLLSVGANVEQRTVFGQSCFYKAFLTKNLDFMKLCVLAGFKLHTTEPWIKEYLANPDFIDYTDYYVKRATSSRGSNSSHLDEASSELIKNRTDQELNEILYLDEYFYERFHSSNYKRKSSDYKRNSELSKSIYQYMKEVYTNPLSLKELSRITVRNKMLRNDFKMKFKVENELIIPRRLKDYLLFKEFGL